jgi:hypothetical protein
MPERPDVRIAADGGHATVTVGDANLSGAVQGVVVRHRPGHVAEVELDLCVRAVDYFAEAAQVIVPDATRAALVALGWTPPPGD